ncbi:hypothetical protein J7K86_00530 [bacterium]|nr:hypothetical protein [bacterium]
MEIQKEELNQEINKVEKKVSSSKRKFSWKIFIFTIAIVVIVGGAYFLYWKQNVKLAEKGRIQAVFLVNGQVYFGHIVKQTRNWIILRDVYYLQIQQLSTKEGEKPKSQPTLVKLGNELHKPTSEMKINRDQILFVENLKSDSPISETIKKAE